MLYIATDYLRTIGRRRKLYLVEPILGKFLFRDLKIQFEPKHFYLVLKMQNKD